MCADLGVDPTDIVLLAISHELASKRMCEISKEGWLEGWTRNGCFDAASMKNIVATLRAKLKEDNAYFKTIYKYSFQLSLDENQRSLRTSF